MDATLKTSAIKKIEEKLDAIDGNSMRAFLLQSAKNFKTSWIELGRALFAVKKDKLFYDWGFDSFDVYAQKEVGIKKQTALKLIKSYAFLEKEETWFLEKRDQEEEQPSLLPNYEAVDVLRLAKQKKDLAAGDYETLRKSVFEEGKDHKEVKKDLTALMKQREEVNPEDARMQARLKTIKRFLSTMRSTKEQLETLNMLPNDILNEADKLIAKIEEYV